MGGAANITSLSSDECSPMLHRETSQLKVCFSELLHIYEQGGKEKGQGDMWVDAGSSGRVSDLPCGMGQPGPALLDVPCCALVSPQR